MIEREILGRRSKAGLRGCLGSGPWREAGDTACRVKMLQVRTSGNRLVPSRLPPWSGQWLPGLWRACPSL